MASLSARELSLLATLLASRHHRLPGGVLAHRAKVLVADLDEVLEGLTAQDLVREVQVRIGLPCLQTQIEWELTAKGQRAAAVHLARWSAQRVVAERREQGLPDPRGGASRPAPGTTDAPPWVPGPWMLVRIADHSTSGGWSPAEHLENLRDLILDGLGHPSASEVHIDLRLLDEGVEGGPEASPPT